MRPSRPNNPGVQTDSLNEVEAGKFVSRLLSYQTRNGLTQKDLARKVSIVRSTLYRWIGGDTISRTAAIAVCERMKWTALFKQLVTAPMISSHFQIFLTPGDLMRAAKYSRSGMPVYQSQVIHAAASILLINLQAKGVSATVTLGNSLDDRTSKVIVYHHNNLPKRGVRFSIDGEMLCYRLINFTPSGQEVEGVGPATEDGFGFCLEYLHPREEKTTQGKTPDLRKKLLDETKRLSGI